MQACETVHAFNARIFGIQRVRYLEFFASPIHHIYIYTVAPIKLHRTARAFFARGDEGLRDVYEYHTKVHNTNERIMKVYTFIRTKVFK